LGVTRLLTKYDRGRGGKTRTRRRSESASVLASGAADQVESHESNHRETNQNKSKQAFSFGHNTQEASRNAETQIATSTGRVGGSSIVEDDNHRPSKNASKSNAYRPYYRILLDNPTRNLHRLSSAFEKWLR
jgi:hypothetical protein